ncbi:MAG: metallophosphoesterase [Thermoleophilaceae bacterium]
MLVLATAAMAADRRRPDLELARLTGAPVQIATRAGFTVGTEVKNRGGARSGPATVRFLLTRPGTRTRIGSRSVPALAPGGVSKRSTGLSASVAPGTWRLVACVRGHCRAAKRTTRVTRRPAPTPPAPVTLTSPPDGALIARRRPLLAGAADPGGPVTVVIARGSSSTTATARPRSDGRWSTQPSAPLADGAYTARARQGGRISAARSFTIDATAPKVTIDHPADGGTTNLMAFDGDAGDGGPVTARLSNGTALPVDRSGPRWSALATPLDPGSYTLTAEQRDAAGNVGRATAQFTVPFSLLAAGDIAACDSSGDEATAAILAQRAGTIATLGDNAYDSPPEADPYPDCYDPSWGPFKPRTMPAAGNHEYEDSLAAADYFTYFGTSAGAPGAGYYSYDVGAWHVIVLNTSDNCSQVGCSAGSPQETWLRADLATHSDAKCTLAYFHHPRFSSYLGADTRVQPLWEALRDGGADLVLNGHAHDYERFPPLAPDGTADPAGGITEIIAGTGGRSHHTFPQQVDPRSLVRNDDSYGILDLTLRPAGWSWEFLPAAAASFTDGGSADCH